MEFDSEVKKNSFAWYTLLSLTFMIIFCAESGIIYLFILYM